jgi:P4 family phage/plasmid primase-like protien
VAAEIPAIFDQPDAAFVLLPTGIKYPPVEREWQKKPHTFAEATAHMGNVGAIAGYGYIGLDLDTPDAFNGLELPATTSWETRPGRYGMRFKCSDVTSELLATYGKKADLSQFHLYKDGVHVGEIKLQNSYQTIPNSHKFVDPNTGDDVRPGKGDRVDYKLLDSSPPAEISLAKLLADLLVIGITFSEKPKTSRLEANAAKLEDMGKKARQAYVESDDTWTRRYALAALHDEVLVMAGTEKNDRNIQLNKSAFALGQFVGAGVLSETEVISELFRAVENAGLEPEEIRATIKSGLGVGAKHPREIPKASYKGQWSGEAVKKAAIELEDVADIEYDKNDKIKKIRFSPTLAARSILEKMPLAMAEDSENIYRFNGQIYRPDGARIIDRVLCDVAGDSVTGDKLREVMRRIKNDLLESPVVFELDPYLLAVKNGVADLRTGEVGEYRVEDLLLEQLEVNHIAGARCPVFLAFLESITPNVSDRITLIDWFVATAIKEPLAYVLFLLGLGRNGKGIYEKLIKKLFGQAAFRDMPLAEVSKNNFAASGFYRKRGWIASETGKKKVSIGTDFMKLVSGNGVIDGDRKNKSRIQFEPYFQVIVDTNTMPKIEDNSIGWMERFVKVDLPYIFVVEPDPKNSLEKQRDPALYTKLTTPSELSGILNLLLFRSPVITKNMTITKRSGSEMFAEYNEQSSSVATFLDLFCDLYSRPLITR